MDRGRDRRYAALTKVIEPVLLKAPCETQERVEELNILTAHVLPSDTMIVMAVTEEERIIVQAIAHLVHRRHSEVVRTAGHLHHHHHGVVAPRLLMASTK